jgi:lipoprotein-anchoring transpeptidase ErfK/SrfK
MRCLSLVGGMPLVMLAFVTPAFAQQTPTETAATPAPVDAPTVQPVEPVPAPVATPTPVTPPAAVTPPADPPKKKGPVDSLKPGQFVWEKRESYNNPLRLVAVLDIQRLYVFDGDDLVGFATISTGKKGKETPTGAYKILQKKVYHESNIYANAPMPFMQRLTWDGIALHAGHNPGYPASHGCIRLPKPFAQALYDATQMDGEVVILASLSKPKPKPQPIPPVVDPQAPVNPAAPAVQPEPVITPTSA